MSKWTTARMPDQSGRVAIVTGSNSGIGFETAKALAGNGARVVLACRNPQRAEEALARLRDEVPDADLDFIALDLANLDSIAAFAESFRAAHDRLDLLINNAGVMVPPPSKTAQGFELQFGVNHIGHFALTGRLIDILIATDKSRVVTVSSIAHKNGRVNFDDLNWESRRYMGGIGAYGQSKLANLLFAFELNRRLAKAGNDTISVASHPGITSTNLQRHMGVAERIVQTVCMDPDQGALPSLRAATDPDVRGGEYYGPGGIGEMWGYPKTVPATRRARNLDAAARLWDYSVEATGVDYGALAG